MILNSRCSESNNEMTCAHLEFYLLAMRFSAISQHNKTAAFPLRES